MSDPILPVAFHPDNWPCFEEDAPEGKRIVAAPMYELDPVIQKWLVQILEIQAASGEDPASTLHHLFSLGVALVMQTARAQQDLFLQHVQSVSH